MQPNDLPIVVLPLELSDDAAASLVAFLYDLTEALERHYAGQLLHRQHDQDTASPPPDPLDRANTDPSF